MSPFSTNRAKRHTAFVTLLLWLFALASGMVNACLLDTPGTHSHTVTGGFVETLPAVAVAVAALKGHESTHDDHDDDLGTAKESCEKTCDDGSNAPVKLQTDPHLTDLGPALLVAILWNATTPVVLASSPRDSLSPPIAGPPVRVRYARLTL